MNTGMGTRWGALLSAWMWVALSACTTTPTVKVSSPELDRLGTAQDTASGSIVDTLGGYKDRALEAIGFKKPELPELPEVQLPDRQLLWRLHASDSLNVSPAGDAVALLTRVYKLRSPNAFLQAPYEVFGDPAKEKAQMGDDVIETREVQMIPGQHHEVKEKVAREVRYIGIVALYRNPSPHRWRYAFRSEAAEKSGLSIGLHACAMSVQVGEPIGQPLSMARSVAVPCPP
ncbi:MAG: type VI secretion system lipoprotein TssJ [Rubrivivax sp.]|nr:MAG: type VI secretion system lipoprotein TssJ [Rubrivivax sp.]